MQTIDARPSCRTSPNVFISFRADFFLYLISIAVYCLAFAPCFCEPLLHSDDSNEYFDYVRYLQSGGFPPPELWYSALRVPGYPILIYLASLLVGTGQELIDSAAQALHFFGALVLMISVPFSLRAIVSPAITALALLAVLVAADVYYFCLLTEWSSILIMCCLISAVCLYMATRGLKMLFAAIFLLSSAILVHSSLVVLLILPLAEMLRPGRRVAKFLVISVALTPLLIWMLFNYARLGIFNITPRGSMHLYAVTATVYPANNLDGGRFYAGADATNRDLELAFNNNFSSLAQVAYVNRWSTMQTKEYANDFSWKRIQTDSKPYLTFVALQLGRVLVSLAGITWLGLFASLIFLRVRVGIDPLIDTACVFAAVHATHVIAISVVGVALPRLMDATFYPFVFICSTVFVSRCALWLNQQGYKSEGLIKE